MLISEFPVVSVHIPPVLRGYTRGHEEVMASGETVGEVLIAVGHTYPELGSLLLSSPNRLAPGLSVFLSGMPLSAEEATAMPVAADEVLSLVATGELDGLPGFSVRDESAPLGEISIGV